MYNYIAAKRRPCFYISLCFLICLYKGKNIPIMSRLSINFHEVFLYVQYFSSHFIQERIYRTFCIFLSSAIK